MILGSWVSTYLRANSTIRFVISLRLKGMNGRQQTICPPSKRLLFFYWWQTTCQQNPTLYKSKCQEDDNNTVEIGAEREPALAVTLGICGTLVLRISGRAF